MEVNHHLLIICALFLLVLAQATIQTRRQGKQWTVVLCREGQFKGVVNKRPKLNYFHRAYGVPSHGTLRSDPLTRPMICVAGDGSRSVTRMTKQSGDL